MGQWETYDMCFFCLYFTKIPFFDILWHQQPKNENLIFFFGLGVVAILACTHQILKNRSLLPTPSSSLCVTRVTRKCAF